MKKDWQTKTLGDVCIFDKAQGLHKNIPYVGLEHIESHTARFIGSTAPQSVKSSTFRFSNEHILYGRLRPYLNKVLAPNFVGHCSTEIFPIKPRTHLSREYLVYWFLSNETVDRINATCTGARMPRADMNEVLNFEFSFPSLPEQQRIVGILDEAFEGIATAKANAEKNRQNARALFESHLQSVFTQHGKGYVEKTLGEVCILRSGTTLPKEIEKPSGEIPYLKVADMNLIGNLNGVTCSSRYINKIDVNVSNLLPLGTTIFPKRGGAILTNKKRLTERVICADLNIMGVAPSKALLPRLLYFYFLNVDMRELGSGSSIPQINNYDIEPLKISFPIKLDEQEQIVIKLDALSKETQRLESLYQRKLDALDALKKSLLHQAFSGAL
jgi:type I restriction enzyme, S subunit